MGPTTSTEILDLLETTTETEETTIALTETTTSQPEITTQSTLQTTTINTIAEATTTQQVLAVTTPAETPTTPETCEIPICNNGDSFLVHPCDCNSYYQCDNLIPIERTCGTLCWNPSANSC